MLKNHYPPPKKKEQEAIAMQNGQLVKLGQDHNSQSGCDTIIIILNLFDSLSEKLKI